MAFSFELGLAIPCGRYGAISAGPEQDKLNQVYNALFTHSYTLDQPIINVGNLHFGAENRTRLLQAVSMISIYADYNL